MEGVTRVGVVGGGQMGSGIAEVCGRAGFETQVVDVNAGALDAAQSRIERSLARAVERGKLEMSDRDVAWSLMRFDSSLDLLARCDLTIEAITEDLEIKRRVFATLDGVLTAEAIMATNTSSLPIGEIASATNRPDRVMGLHFFNPPPVMPLVELVRSTTTSEQTFARVKAFARQVGKEVIVAPDRAGFIVNTLLMPYLLNAIRFFERGLATREDIDAGMRLGCSHPMGPLQLADYIGLDTVVFICDAIHTRTSDDQFLVPQSLRSMVTEGYLGQKSGSGFYEYNAAKAPA